MWAAERGTVSTGTLRGDGARLCPGIRKEANSWSRDRRGEETHGAGRGGGHREQLGLYSGTGGSHCRA